MEQRVAAVRRLNEELERRVTERTAQLEAANQELEAFSYSVSHDLRAPLRHIDGFSKLMLERSGGADETTAHYLRTLANSAKRMSKLIDALLALSRTGRAEIRMQDVDLNDLMSDARKECAEGAQGRDITWKVGDLPHVRGDRALLRIVLVNLLSNSVKFTSKRDAAIIEIGASRGENGEAVVCVRDNGAGFDMRYADKLFGVFQRLHREDEFEGTGVGLATVRRIVHRHGGRVWAQGETGRGAAFYVALKTARE
jgi:light-regulated signal transduction histidine kinase (bacteriophytochrome)